MKIDWKLVSQSPGYISLKNVYIKAVQESESYRRRFNHNIDRNKNEHFEKFKWVISRAKHYAHHTGVPIEKILNEWEEKRKYCWRNYYQDCNQPKFRNNILKPIGLKGFRKSNRKSRFYNKIEAKHRNCDFIQRQHKEKCKNDEKPRWLKDKKITEARIRGYKLEDPNWGKYPSKKKNKIKKRKIKEEINKLKGVRK